MATAPSFVGTTGDTYRQKLAAMLAQGALDTSPIQSGWQGASRMGQALVSALMMRGEDARDREASDFKAKLMGQLLGGTGAPATLPSAPAAPPASPAFSAQGSTGVDNGALVKALGGNAGAAPAVGPGDLVKALAGTGAGVSPSPAMAQGGNVADRIIGNESGGNPNARNPMSSAAGPGQFINSTWLDTVRRNRPDLAGQPDAVILAMRSDPNLARDMTAAYAAQNGQTLGAAGLPVTPGTQYLAHFAGPAGALAVLRADPATPVLSVLGPDVVRANPFLANMTTGDLRAWADRKMAGASNGVGADMGVAPSTVPQQGMPQAGAPQAAPQMAPAPNNAAMIPPEVRATIMAGLNSPNPQIRQAAAAMASRYIQTDPTKQLQAQKLQLEIAKMQGRLPGQTEYGLNPVYGTDEHGNQVIGTIGKDGTFKRIDTGDVKVSSGVEKIDAGTEWLLMNKKDGTIVGRQPKDIVGKESQTEIGKAQGKARATLPTDLQTAEQTVKEIDQLINHPGLDSIVGPIDQYRSGIMLGAEGRDALARFNQLKGRSFLQAYSILKGGGQITEIEGTKAENAMARMDRAQSEAEFKAALKDFRDAVDVGMTKLRERAGVAAQQQEAAPTVPPSQGQPLSPGSYQWDPQRGLIPRQ